jgi:uncharacterized membrane protein YoaK (UPF0700 family)
MNETGESGATFSISIGLALVGGYADASSYLLARTFTGHLTGNCVLAAVSAASGDWYLTLDRLLAVIVFVGGILCNSLLNRCLLHRSGPSSLAIAMLMEVFLFLIAALFLRNSANRELFIFCMGLALGMQNGALHKTNGISVHSTYVTGMVTMLMQKAFDPLSSKQGLQEHSSKDTTRLTIQVLAPMWISFVMGALLGAVMVLSFHWIGLLGMPLLLILLVLLEMKRKRTPPGTSPPGASRAGPIVP